MSEAPGDPSAQAAAAEGAVQGEGATAAEGKPAPRPPQELGVRSLLEAGAHFGHQTRRWNPKMKPFIFGERGGIHIIDLDQTLPRLEAALEFVRETVAQGGKVLFVATKRQASDPVRVEAERCGQYYVNNRWLGGMLTNFRTVRRSIELFKEQLSLLADEEKVGELAKKELSRLNRSVTKYRKSLDGIREMTRLPDALFVIDIAKEHIAISEARRLGIPVVAVVDTNCSPEGIDFPIPGNDDAIRAIELYCRAVGDACLEGAEIFNERVTSQERPAGRPEAEGGPSTGRRVVEIKQQPGAARRGARQSGGPRQAGGTHSAAGRGPRREAPPVPSAEPAAAAATPAEPAAAPAEPAAAPAASEGETPSEG